MIMHNLFACLLQEGEYWGFRGMRYPSRDARWTLFDENDTHPLRIRGLGGHILWIFGAYVWDLCVTRVMRGSTICSCFVHMMWVLCTWYELFSRSLQYPVPLVTSSLYGHERWCCTCRISTWMVVYTRDMVQILLFSSFTHTLFL